MDSLPERLIDTPLPCAALAVYDEAHAKLREYILAAGRANTRNNQDRLNVIVSGGRKITDEAKAEENQWEPEIPPCADWVLLQRRAPTCVVCVRDWQHFVLEDITSANSSDAPSAEVSDSQKEGDPADDSSAARSDTKPRGDHSPTDAASRILRGDLKRLTELIKEDVEQCVMAYRRNLLDKRPVPGKMVFLILLREGIKNPHKAVNGLKHLNPNEVAAVCVTCGAEDIANKIAKLEQLIYDLSVAYYEKRVSLLSKTIHKMKPSSRSTENESTDIEAVVLNFKLGYFHKFLGNFKESAQALALTWGLIIPCAWRNPKEEQITLALYVALQLIGARFATSNLLEALTFAFEAVTFFKKAMISEDIMPLYHNVVYLIQHAVALHLDRSREYKELRDNHHVRQHAVNFYKWSIQHLLNLRILIMKGGMDTKQQKLFANLLLRGDDDFKHLFVEDAIDDGIDTDQRLKNLEHITERMLVNLIALLSTCSWYNTLLQVTQLLGDSLFLSSNLREAFFVYSNIGEALINATALDTDYILKSCSSVVMAEEFKRSNTTRATLCPESRIEEDTYSLHPNFLKNLSTLLLAEHGQSEGWGALYRCLLAKMIIVLNMLLGQPVVLPESIRRASGLPLDIYESWASKNSSNAINKSANDLMIAAAAENRLLLMKMLLTLTSVTDGEFDINDTLAQLASGISPQDNISTAIILSKHHKGQYMLGRAQMADNTIATRLQVLINFHVDLPFNIEVSYVTICTSIGTFDFEISDSRSRESHTEIYATGWHAGYDLGAPNDLKREDSNSTNSEDGQNTEGVDDKPVGKTVSLNGDHNVLLAITCPPINNKFMVDSFELLGLKLLWKMPLHNGHYMDVMCLVPSLSHYTRLGVTSPECSLFAEDTSTHKFSLMETCYRLGVSTSTFKAEDILQRTMINPKVANNNRSVVDTIVELIDAPRSNVQMENSVASEVHASYEHGTYRMFVNRIFFKVFMGTLVEGHLAPLTCVLLYNKQILDAQNLPHIKFSVEVASSANSFFLYVLCKDSGATGGSMRKCINNKFDFTLMEFADAKGFNLELGLDTANNSDMDTVAPALFADDEGSPCSISNEMDNFLELARKDSNVGIVYIHGLLKVMSHGITNVQLNLQMQPMHGNTLKAVEDNFLAVTDITEAWVHEPVQIDLAMDMQYNNVDANFLRFLIMHIVNKTDVRYDINHVKVLWEDKIIAENDDLYGFCKQLQNRQALQFMYLPPSDDESKRSVEVQFGHSVIHPAVFPFDRLQRGFQIVATKTSSLSNQDEATDIAITLRHSSTVDFGEPFELIAEIRNLTSHTLDYCVTLPNSEQDRSSFLIAGHRLLEMTALPYDVNTVKWTLIATSYGHHSLPKIKVAQRRKISLAMENFESTPSKVYVVPQKLMHA